MYSDQVRDDVEGQEEEEGEEEKDGEDTAMLGYWSNPEAEVSYWNRKWSITVLKTSLHCRADIQCIVHVPTVTVVCVHVVSHS